MSLKDEFLKSLIGQQKDGKIRFALDDHGDITHLIKRVDPRCREVYEKLAALRSPYLPAVLLMKEVDGALEVHEEYIRGQTLEAYAQELSASDMLENPEHVISEEQDPLQGMVDDLEEHGV